MTRTTTHEVMVALARRYKAPAYAFMQQVGHSTGFGNDGWADAIALGLWPSRGIDLHGFEVKVSRADWLRELAQPAKSDAFVSRCDYWWLVLGNDDVLKIEELPRTWGAMLLTSRGFKVLKDAPKNHRPVPLDRPALAAIIRRATEHSVSKTAAENSAREARLAGEESGRRLAGDRPDEYKRELEQLKKDMAAFEAKSGVAIRQYNGAHVGEIFAVAKALHDVDHSWLLDGLDKSLDQSRALIRSARIQIQNAVRQKVS